MNQQSDVIPKLSRVALRCLAVLAKQPADYPYMSFATIAADANVPLCRVRRTVRHLARKGLAQYARGLWTDEGRPFGSGYCATPAGRAVAPKEGSGP